MSKASVIIELGRTFQAKYGETHFQDFIPKYKPGDLLKSKKYEDVYGVFIKYEYPYGGFKNQHPNAAVLIVEKDYDQPDTYFSTSVNLYTPGSFGGPAYTQLSPTRLDIEFDLVGHKGEYNLDVNFDRVSKKQ